MATPAQITANIVNAQQSTGPRTEPGKAASSRNSLKHGLTAQTVLLPGEDEEAYRQLRSEFFEAYDPQVGPERELVQNLCDLQWRINRCARLEVIALSGDTLDLKALDVISRHETRLSKLYSATLKEVREMMLARIGGQEAMMKEAMLVRRADVLKGRPTDLKVIGFDLPVQRVDAALARQDALRRASKVVSQQFAA